MSLCLSKIQGRPPSIPPSTRRAHHPRHLPSVPLSPTLLLLHIFCQSPHPFRGQVQRFNVQFSPIPPHPPFIRRSSDRSQCIYMLQTLYIQQPCKCLKLTRSSLYSFSFCCFFSLFSLLFLFPLSDTERQTPTQNRTNTSRHTHTHKT